MQHVVFFKIIMLLLFGVATKAISLDEITASDGVLGDLFGYSVSISGTTAIVGAFEKKIRSNSDQGAAYIFTCPTPSNCTQASELTASNGAPSDFFGISVSILGTTAIVGADGKNTYQGAAYIFTCPSPANCTQASELLASDGASHDLFGQSVSISGTTAIVGAYGKKSGSNSTQGAAYIFTCPTPANCTQTSKLTASNGGPSDQFGFSVSISGTTAIVGANGKNSQKGAAYIFSCPTPSNCTQASELLASNGAPGDYFGGSVSISGTTAIVGAIYSNSNKGGAYIFTCPTPTNCTQVAELLANNSVSGDQFGFSVSIDGTTVIVGANGKNNYQGAAYIFTCATPSNCTQIAELLASNGAPGDYFGGSVSISGTMAIVGVDEKKVGSNSVTQGAAYVVGLPTPTTTSTPTPTSTSTPTLTSTPTSTQTSTSTPTSTPTPSPSSSGFAGNFSGTLSGTINLKSCSVYLNGLSLSGYAIVDSQNSNSFCCLQKGVIHGASCVRGSCANPIAFGLFATIIDDSTDCLVDCISSSSSLAQNSVFVSVLSATSGSIYAGTPQSISLSPSQGYYLVLNGAYIPVYSFSVGSPGQQYACLTQGQYDSSTCYYTTGCNAATSVPVGFFYYATSCYMTCYPVNV